MIMRPGLYAMLIILLISPAGCGFKKETIYSGKTMGTAYRIKIVTWFFHTPKNLHNKIKTSFKEINACMSTFDKTSEISRFNAHRARTPVEVSPDFMDVVKTAKKIYTLTDGAWDGTINPVVNLWGFGGDNRQKQVPGKEEIEKLLPHTGFHHIKIIERKSIQKTNPRVSLDLASIAKGYAVDRIARLISDAEIENYIVEIGGEVYASGVRKDGKKWRVGVNLPEKGIAFDAIYKIVSLQAMALATSGDYRNFFEVGHKRYTHVIDPKTGIPVDNGVVSASVLAPTCAFADGLATALMVMGHEKGLALVNSLDRVECLIIVKGRDNKLIDFASDGFKTKQ